MLLECLKENFINCEIKEFKVEVNGFMFEVTYNPNQSGGSYILHYKYNKFEDWDIAKDPESIWDRINGFFAFIEDIKLSPEMYRDSYIA